jgi:tripartite-type tricarboxylate transporter receptor subunit TctC
MFPTLQSAVPHVKSNRLRLIAVTTEKRSPAFPETPTTREAGVSGVVASAWFGIQAPRGTPKPVVDRLHADTVKVLQDAAVRQRFESESAEVVGSTPEEFRSFIGNEIGKWTKVVKDAGIKLE